MKKLLALVLVTTAIFSCSKNESEYKQDSNIMLEEPKVEVTVAKDSTTTQTTPDSTATAK